MNWHSLIGPAVVAAGVSGLISIVGFIVSARTARTLHAEKLEFDRKLAEQKFEFDKALAERKFQYDRDLHDHKRKVEFAEMVLAQFLQANDVIIAIRWPVAYAEEGARRPRGENETDEQRREKDTYYVPLARINKNSDFISALMSKRYQVRVILGESAEQAFRELDGVLDTIRTSAIALIHMIDRTGVAKELHPETVKGWEQDIWYGFGEDRLQLRVTAAIKAIENVCKPILEGQGPA